MTSLVELCLQGAPLAQRLEELGARSYDARSLKKAVLEDGRLDYAELTSLPAPLRETLAVELPVLAGRELDLAVSSDGTQKLLIGFDRKGGGYDTVETVHIPPSRRDSKKGATLCVSTQVGCPVGCPFCASGRAGLVRNLTAAEILEQFLRGRALGPLSRAVVMGIGEPLLNYENLRRALDVVHDSIGIGARKITVSSVGFPDRVRRVAVTRPPFQLAISLHTPFDEERDELVPAMRGTRVEEILAAGDFWFQSTGREVTYEITLLEGCNTTAHHAEELARVLAGRRCTVNLIPYNPVPDSHYGRPSAERVDDFREHLDQRGIVCTVRWSRGLGNDAACGQLRLRTVDTEPGQK